MTPEQLQSLNEEKVCEQYFTKYKKHMQAFEKSLVSKATRLHEHHFIQLGKQLDQWELYRSLHEANGSLNTLGAMPLIALDVITAVMSNTVMPVIASTQTIEEQKQLIWFKNIHAEDTKGNLTAGQKILDPRTGKVTASGYSSNQISAEEGVAATVGAQVAYSFNLAAVPVYRETLRLTFSDDAEVYAEDVGPRGSDNNIGTLLGKGLSGTVNYTTGAVSITFAADPTVGHQVYAAYQQNLELAADIPRVSTFLDSVTVQTKAYALKSVMGMFQQYTLKKRFGDSQLEDSTMDLVGEINAEVAGDLILGYSANAVGTTNFSLTILPNISEKDHREAYAFRMADAEATMIGNAGRGTIKVMIVGREHAALVRGLDGFQLLSDGGSLGPHIFGTYKGITYVRVPESALLDPKHGIGLYTGASPLESAGVYCPYMPLTVSEAKSHGVNPLQEQKVAAQLAAVKTVVPQYATKFNITA